MWPCLRTRGGPAAPLLCFCVSLPSAGFLFPMLIFQPFNIKPTTFTFQWPFLKVLLAPKYKSSMSNAIIICIIVCVVLFEHNSWLFLSLSPVYHSCHSEDKCPPCTFLTQKWCMGKHEVSFLSSGSLFRDLWLDCNFVLLITRGSHIGFGLGACTLIKFTTWHVVDPQ